MAISLTHTAVATAADDPAKEINKAEWNDEHVLEMATAKLLGRSTASTGAVEEITVGSGLALSAGTLSATGGGGGDLDDLGDVIITTPSSGQVLKYNGSEWVNDTDATGGGGSSFTYNVDVTGTADADISAAVNTYYVRDISGYGANRNLTLPATAAVGDKVGVVLAVGDATFSLIIKANTGDTLNGVSAAEWSRIKVTGEKVEATCIVANAAWMVTVDGRISVRCIMRLTTQADGEAATTWVMPDDLGGAWTAVGDNFSAGVTATGSFTAPRAGQYQANLRAASKDSSTDGSSYRACLSLNDQTTTPVSVLLGQAVQGAAGVTVVSAAGILDLAAGDVLTFFFRSNAGSIGAGAYTTSSSAFGTSFSVAEIL